ncbi:MAG: glycosyltransferase, partial [Lachnospiraceae bacterium]|nr:glycosyltransferase [Lachnospiraceae bacterium]
YDIIHLHTSSWRGFLIEQTAMKMGIRRVIVHSHSAGIDIADEGERERQMEEHEKYKSQFSMKYATDVWACSSLAAEWLFGKNIPRKKIQILPDAIDINKYRFNPVKRQEIRAALNLENRIVIGNVGRYTYQKNQEFLIKAFAQAHAKTPSLFLLCLGEGELLEYLKCLANKFGIENNTLFMEWQENVEDYLQGMDLFCFPSRFEGLSISVIEAQAAGVKCLISDSIPEEVKITDLVKVLPLIEAEWVKELAGCRIDVDRHRQDENIAKAGYDIQRAAKRLENFYRI